MRVRTESQDGRPDRRGGAIREPVTRLTRSQRTARAARGCVESDEELLENWGHLGRGPTSQKNESPRPHSTESTCFSKDRMGSERKSNSSYEPGVLHSPGADTGLAQPREMAGEPARPRFPQEVGRRQEALCGPRV